MKGVILRKGILFLIKALTFVRMHDIDLEKVLAWIKEADQKEGMTGEEKSEFVRGRISEVLRVSAPYAIDMIIGLAVGLAAKEKSISISRLS